MEEGKTVSVHYVGTFDDGTEFDNSRSRGEPMTFQLGTGQVIPGFDSAISEMDVGETRDIHLEPAQAYGDLNPDANQEVSLDMFPADFEFKEGATVYGKTAEGQQMMANIVSVGVDNVTLDFNHPMAGKNLNFNVELISVQ